jgi:hypothetical protein
MNQLSSCGISDLRPFTGVEWLRFASTKAQSSAMRGDNPATGHYDINLDFDGMLSFALAQTHSPYPGVNLFMNPEDSSNSCALLDDFLQGQHILQARCTYTTSATSRGV